MNKLMRRTRREWWVAAPLALIAFVVEAALMSYWFGTADRYAVFLYNHLGAQPFDAVTVGRYWMTGLVAGGFLLIIIIVLYLASGWTARRYGDPVLAPDWQRAWLLASLPTALFVIWTTTSRNAPTLTVSHGIGVAAVALLAMALALSPAPLAARRPRELTLLALTGMGLVPTLMLVRAIELPASGRLTDAQAWGIAGGALLVSVVWMLVVRWWLRRNEHPAPTVLSIVAAGCAWAYLFLPFVHYLFFTPSAYRYISSPANFFASSLPLQIAVWLLAWAIAMIAGRRRTVG